MLFCLLYTSFRQYDELHYVAQFLGRTRILRHEADIVYHNNNPAFNADTLRARVEAIPAKSIQFIHNPATNAGAYAYGQFEAICDAWPKLLGKGYDWIIHMHPDIQVIDEQLLLSALQRADEQGASIMVTKIKGHRQPAYATDFFAFRPSDAMLPIFESYRPFLKTDIVVELEKLFFNEIFRSGLPHVVVDRFAGGHYHRDIDFLGLWHEHHLHRLDRYLQNPSRRWLTTAGRCVARPKPSVRILAAWVARKWIGKPQDSLGKQLTVL